MNIKIGKKLGVGYMGSVYSARVDGVECIYKIEKLDVEYDTKSPYKRQVDFNDWAKQYPDKFMTLISHGVINTCNHKQPLPPQVRGKFKKELEDKNKLEKCYYLVYRPILDGTIKTIKNILTNNQYIDMVYQLTHTINLLKNNGWYHRDIHDGNIMYKKKGNKYQWYIIDYGLIYRKEWMINNDDKIMLKQGFNDLISIVWTICDNPIIDHIDRHNIKLPKYETFVKRLINSSIWTDIKKYLSSSVKSNLRNESIAGIAMVINYDEYMKALGVHDRAYSYYKQRYPELLLYMIKHVTDNDYEKILKYIKNI
jgi:serine/threonine protein kinase